MSPTVHRLVTGSLFLLVTLSATLALAERFTAIQGVGRAALAEPAPFRYAVIGNSEANSILTHSPDAFHFWESRATLIDRSIQIELAQNKLARLTTVLVNVNPVELTIDPACLAFGTRWPVGLENSQMIRARGLATYAHATLGDLLVNPAKPLAALERYLAINPVTLIHRVRGRRTPGPTFRNNGSVIRNDSLQVTQDVALDALTAESVRQCISETALARIAHPRALSAIRRLTAMAHESGLCVALVVTPLHPAYRRSLDAFLATEVPKAHLSTDALIGALSQLPVPVINDATIFDSEDIAFLNGDHLSSHGERRYASHWRSHLERTLRSAPSAHLKPNCF